MLFRSEMFLIQVAAGEPRWYFLVAAGIGLVVGGVRALTIGLKHDLYRPQVMISQPAKQVLLLVGLGVALCVLLEIVGTLARWPHLRLWATLSAVVCAGAMLARAGDRICVTTSLEETILHGHRQFPDRAVRFTLGSSRPLLVQTAAQPHCGRFMAALRAQCGAGFLLVTPGIRPSWSASGDQKRVTTPAEAIASGADHLVIGRPVTQAPDPAEALARICAEIEAGA